MGGPPLQLGQIEYTEYIYLHTLPLKRPKEKSLQFCKSKGQREVEKRQQWTSSVNKLLEKQQQELIKQKNLNTKDLKETYNEKWESSGALNSLGGWRHQWLWKMRVEEHVGKNRIG